MTLSQWFKLKTGMSFSRYKQLFASGQIESGVEPSEIKMIWDAALSFGDVPKVKTKDVKPFPSAGS